MSIEMYGANPFVNWVLLAGLVYVVYQLFLKDKFSLSDLKGKLPKLPEKAPAVVVPPVTKTSNVDAIVIDDVPVKKKTSESNILNMVSKWQALRDALEASGNDEGVKAADAMFILLNVEDKD